jgi:release factor glutamine methyltransferase
MRSRGGQRASRWRAFVGVKEFWSRDFALSPDTLVPRPESETLIEAALAAKPERDAPLRVLDLGVGSGILLGAILLERPAATGVGVDRSADAVKTAQAQSCRDRRRRPRAVFCGNWGESIGTRFDLVVANPPYIASADMAGLPVEVRAHDPARALDGGADGLDAYRAILADLGRLLAPAVLPFLNWGRGRNRRLRNWPGMPS